MPKTDADLRSPQSVLFIIRMPVGILRWVNYQLKSPHHGHTKERQPSSLDLARNISTAIARRLSSDLTQ
ncbi:MAG TPA: hypothetical protein VN957_07640 [Chthoniobacterales bacterium]|nr:hypothetical protein [Chthoniobacterales bacterium]